MARIRSADDATEVTERPLSRRVAVTVRRDAMTDSARVVWAHEVPILELIFGEGNVREVPSEKLDEGYARKATADMMPFNKTQDQIMPPSETLRVGWVFTGDPEAEYERLKGAYGRHIDVPQPNVEFLYGRYQTGRFRDLLGRPRLEDLPAAQLRDLVLAHGYSLPVATYESDDAERKQAAEAWARFRTADHATLVKLAREVGAEIPA